MKQTILAFALLVGISGFLVTPIASAADCGGKPLGVGQSCCGGVVTSIISCTKQTGTGTSVENTGVWGILLLTINILTAGVGVLAVGGVIYGSVLYTSASGSAEQTKKAKVVIFNVVIGLVMYALMFSFLNWIIPGGLFS